MQPDYEIAWHGSKWRDDRLVVLPPNEVMSTAQGLSPAKRPHAHRGGRKPVIAPAVERAMRTAEKPLTALEVFARVQPTLSANCTIAGVTSALFRLKTDGKIERCEERITFGRFGCTYRWIANPFAAVTMKMTPAQIGRLGGLKKAANQRAADAR